MNTLNEEKRIKQKKSLKEWIIEDIRNDLRMWRGGLSGAVVGYLTSYFFQDEIIRAKLGFWGYLVHFLDILFSFENRFSAQIAATAWFSIAIGITLGVLVEKKLIDRGKIKPWTRKKPGEQGGRPV